MYTQRGHLNCQLTIKQLFTSQSATYVIQLHSHGNCMEHDCKSEYTGFHKTVLTEHCKQDEISAT
jgi:hypothetical protein